MDIGRGLASHMPMIAHKIEDAYQDGELEDWKKALDEERELSAKKQQELQQQQQRAAESTIADPPAPSTITNGDSIPQEDPDEMDLDDQPPDDYGGWEGAAQADRMALDDLLGDILAAK